MLAEGGFQFEKLVRHAWPGPELGGDIRDPSAAHVETMAQLRRAIEMGGGVLHEATFLHAACFARVDMLRISDGCLDLCEIKAKSFDGPSGGEAALHVVDGAAEIICKGGVSSKWLRYIADIAFQAWVVENALKAEGLGAIEVRPRLIVVNRNAVAGEYEAFVNFRLAAEGVLESGHATSSDVCWVKAPPERYRSPLVLEVEVSEPVRQLRKSDGRSKATRWLGKPLDEIVLDAAAIATGEQGIDSASERGWKCRDCEFRVTSDSRQQSGFDLCWGDKAKRADEALRLYRGRGYRPTPAYEGACVREGSADWVDGAIEMVFEDRCIGALPDDAAGGKYAVARNLQIFAERSGAVQRTPDYVSEVRKHLLSGGGETSLHFLDFETTAACLPLAVGMKPYEVVAFQFSCHTAPFDGTMIDLTNVAHTSYLNKADAPPADVVVDDRAFIDRLRHCLGSGGGSVFHWANHECTILRAIRARLVRSIGAGANPSDVSRVEWLDQLIGHGGVRARLVDMMKVAEARIMAPRQGGRYSMKRLLPAICRDDDIWSLVCRLMGDGFSVTADRADRDPYGLLPPMPGAIVVDTSADHGGEDDGVRCGTDAMRAFQQLRFGNVAKWKSVDRDELISAMERYCKLDTVAMVAVWKWMVDQAGRSATPAGESRSM